MVRPKARCPLAGIALIGNQQRSKFAGFEKPLRLERRHAAGAGGGDRLAIAAVLHIAAGKEAGDRHTVFGDQHIVLRANITVVVQIDQAGEELSVGLVANAKKESVNGQRRLLAGLHILQPHAAD